MEGPYIVLLWLLGIVLVAASWIIPRAGGFAYLGALTLAFSAALALLRRNS
jgi:hypothetical protein